MQVRARRIVLAAVITLSAVTASAGADQAAASGASVSGASVSGGSASAASGASASAASATSQGTAALNWPQQRYDAGQTGYDPYETQLNPSNVKNLVTRATVKLDLPFSAAPPVIAGGLVLVTSYYSNGGQPGEIEAFAETCRSTLDKSCRPAWKAPVGYDDSMGVTVADGKVIANTLTINDSQEIWVFTLHCGSGGASCSPLWTTKLGGVSFESAAPTVAGDMIYVPFGEVAHSYLDAFPLKCSTGCRPVWRGKMGDVADGSAAVGNGFAYEADYDGDVYAFQIACATAGNVCSPTWYGSVGENGPRTPAVADGLVFIGSQNGDLFAFKAAGCGASEDEECPPVWRAVTRRKHNILSTPAVGDGLVFVTNYVDGYLYAFPERCGTPCLPTWVAFLSKQDDSSPVVANGVVYAAEGNEPDNVGIDAFSTKCAEHGGTCTPLWHGSGGSYYVPSGPSIVDGELWATGGQEGGPSYLYAFGLPVPSGRAEGTPGTS